MGLQHLGNGMWIYKNPKDQLAVLMDYAKSNLLMAPYVMAQVIEDKTTLPSKSLKSRYKIVESGDRISTSFSDIQSAILGVIIANPELNTRDTRLQSGLTKYLKPKASFVSSIPDLNIKTYPTKVGNWFSLDDNRVVNMWCENLECVLDIVILQGELVVEGGEDEIECFIFDKHCLIVDERIPTEFLNRELIFTNESPNNIILEEMYKSLLAKRLPKDNAELVASIRNELGPIKNLIAIASSGDIDFSNSNTGPGVVDATDIFKDELLNAKMAMPCVEKNLTKIIE